MDSSSSGKQGIDFYDGVPRNVRLYHLLLFETVIKCLRKWLSLQFLYTFALISNILVNNPGSKFDIEDPVFQDPNFSAGDERFLKNWGHKLISYLRADTDPFLMLDIDHPFDKSIAEHVWPQVFVFAPSLVIDATVDMLLTLNPVLYWSIDVCEHIASPHFVSIYCWGRVFILLHFTFCYLF